MITLVRHPIEEIKDDYPLLFISVFGKWVDEGNCPLIVYYGYEDGTFVGIVAGFPISQDTFYIQRSGYIANEQHKTATVRRTREVMAALHGDWPYLYTLVSNADIYVLKMVITCGFMVIGTRVDTKGKVWVELMKEKKDGDQG